MSEECLNRARFWKKGAGRNNRKEKHLRDCAVGRGWTRGRGKHHTSGVGLENLVSIKTNCCAAVNSQRRKKGAQQFFSLPPHVCAPRPSVSACLPRWSGTGWLDVLLAGCTLRAPRVTKVGPLGRPLHKKKSWPLWLTWLPHSAFDHWSVYEWCTRNLSTSDREVHQPLVG